MTLSLSLTLLPVEHRRLGREARRVAPVGVLLADDGEIRLAALLEAAEQVDEHGVHHLVTVRVRARARARVRARARGRQGTPPLDLPTMKSPGQNS